jgi:hypothetical protein
MSVSTAITKVLSNPKSHRFQPAHEINLDSLKDVPVRARLSTTDEVGSNVLLDAMDPLPLGMILPHPALKHKGH